MVDAMVDMFGLRELYEYDAVQQGHSNDAQYFRNPALEPLESLCEACQTFLQQAWYMKTVVHKRLEILLESGQRCHLCFVISDAIANAIAGAVDDGLAPVDEHTWERLLSSAVWGILKIAINRKLAHAEESVEKMGESAEIQAATLQMQEMNNAFDGGLELDESGIQRYPKDSLERDLYAFKEVRLIHMVVGLHNKSKIDVPFPPYSNGSGNLFDPQSKKDWVSAEIEVTPFDDEVCQVLREREDAEDIFTGSNQRRRLCSSWLKKCIDSHDHCPKPNGRSPLPRRVIDVGSSQPLNHPFLHESHGQVGTYAALSHRWGKSQILATHLASIDLRRKHLPMGTLPATFQHTIHVVRSLGIRYLWIDSLCIVQDSSQDWSCESVKMAQIYANATITIAAVDTDDSNSGLFKILAGRANTPCLLGALEYASGSSYNNGQRILPVYARKVPAPRRGTVVSTRPRGPLDTRAWVLQEELLSPRFLSFTEEGIFWECQHSDASESHPEGCFRYEDRYEDRFNPDTKYARSFKRMINPVANAMQEPWALVSPMRAWQSLVSDYTSRALTKDSDAVVAIQGIADTIARLTQYEYILGLWRENIHEDLLWHIELGRAEYISETFGGMLTTFSGYKTPPLLDRHIDVTSSRHHRGRG